MSISNYSQSVKITTKGDNFVGQVDATPHLYQLQQYLASNHAINGEIKMGALEAELNSVPFSASLHPINNTRTAHISIRSSCPNVASKAKEAIKAYGKYLDRN